MQTDNIVSDPDDMISIAYTLIIFNIDELDILYELDTDMNKKHAAERRFTYLKEKPKMEDSIY